MCSSSLTHHPRHRSDHVTGCVDGGAIGKRAKESDDMNERRRGEARRTGERQRTGEGKRRRRRYSARGGGPWRAMGRRDFLLLRLSDQRTRAHETTKSGPRNDVTNHYAHSSVTWLLLKCADFKSILLARYNTFLNTNHFVFDLLGLKWPK